MLQGVQGSSTGRPALVVDLSAAVIDTFPGPALVIGIEGDVVFANGRGAALSQSMPGEEAELMRSATRRAVTDGVCHRLVLELRTDDLMTLLDLTVMPLADDSGALVLIRDQTLEQNLRAALIESRKRYKDLVHISSDVAWEVGADGRIAFVSGVETLGYRPNEMVGHSPSEFLTEGQDRIAVRFFLTQKPIEDVEIWMRRADGRPVCLMGAATPLLGPDSRWVGARGVCRDVTDERERDAVLARARYREGMLSYVVRSFRAEVEPENMLDVAAGTMSRALSVDGCQIFRTHAFHRGGTVADQFTVGAVYGKCGEQETVLPVLDVLRNGADIHESGSDEWRVLAAATHFNHKMNGAICLWRRVGKDEWADDDRILLTDIANQIGIAIEQVAKHVHIVNLSRTDGLTGLYNRRAFTDDLGRRFGRLQREGKPAALMFVDLDNFKLVNDIHGHQRGDEALLAVRNILLGCTRPTDLVARLGGDEFAVWLEGADGDAAVNRARALLEAGAELDAFSGDPARPLQMSLGIAIHDPALPESLEELMARADAAMYEVKRKGKGSYAVAQPPEHAVAQPPEQHGGTS